MILRRVIAHVRKQEWTAIAIDLVIVVLGVVIGIQVSNWNAARVDRERAHGYLERIRDDLEADIVGYRDRLEFPGPRSPRLAPGDSPTPKRAMPVERHNGTSCATTSGRARSRRSTSPKRPTTSSGVRVSWAFSATRACATSWRLTIRIQRIRRCRRARNIVSMCAGSSRWKSSSISGKNAGSPKCQESNEHSPAVRRSMRLAQGPSSTRIRSDTALMRELRYWMSTMRVAGDVGRIYMGVAIGLRDAVDAKVGRHNPAP